MTCREFNQKTEGLTLAEFGRSGDEQLLAHGRECAACASWMQQRQALAGALEGLQSSTARLEAPAHVEYAVMRAFRQSVPAAAAREEAQAPTVFRLSRLFRWGAYAAVAAALAISIGLGIWFWQHSATAPAQSAQQTIPAAQTPTTQQEPSQTASAVPSANSGPVQESANTSSSHIVASRTVEKADVVAKQVEAAAPSGQSLAQIAQAQGYVPLMLCDPLSCSGDEQVVRMELPASAGYGSADSSQPLMADVILGDDGLVRAIRIVQQ